MSAADQWEPPRLKWHDAKMVRNVTFTVDAPTLTELCDEADELGFELVRVIDVPGSGKAVAVFHRVSGGGS